MARCGCASDRCNCNFIAGDNVIITGSGSRSNPYVVEAVVPTGGGTTEPSVSNRFPGEIVAYGGPTAPAGWLLCDGSVIDRSQFSALYGVIGTAYGAGDGMTTFKLPDLRGTFPLGAGGSYARGDQGGSTDQTLVIANLPAHAHTINHTHTINHDHPNTSSAGAHSHFVNMSQSPGGSVFNLPYGTADKSGQWATPVNTDGEHEHNVVAFNGNSGGASTSSSGNTGSGTSFSTMPPYQAVNYIVKT